MIEVIPYSVDDQMNKILTLNPTANENKLVAFSLNKDSAPGPNGFGGVFYQTYWNIIQKDVCNPVKQLFNNGWLLTNSNANIITLIPKTKTTDSLDRSMPIALSNFKFKLISKTIVVRLAKIMSFHVSKEKKGFIQGRTYKDCICLAS